MERRGNVLLAATLPSKLFAPEISFLVVDSSALKYSTSHSPLESKFHKEG